MPAELDGFFDLPISERRKQVASMSRDEIAAVIAKIPAATLLELGQKRIQQLGTYRARLTREERIDGKLTRPQAMELTLRPQPLAVRVEVVSGPGKGRRMLYNEALRPKDLRVREPGLLRALGALWIDIDAKVTRRETRHAITAIGYAPAMRLLVTDFEKARPAGGYARTDEGFDAAGSFCMRFDAPAKARGLTGNMARLCIAPADALITSVEVWDDAGLIERFRFELLQARMTVPDVEFTPEGAGL
jgi:hypothetical protein